MGGHDGISNSRKYVGEIKQLRVICILTQSSSSSAPCTGVGPRYDDDDDDYVDDVDDDDDDIDGIGDDDNNDDSKASDDNDIRDDNRCDSGWG